MTCPFSVEYIVSLSTHILWSVFIFILQLSLFIVHHILHGVVAVFTDF